METLTARRMGAIADLCSQELPVDRLFGELTARLRSVVPYDASTWFATDPATVLATAPALIENIESGHCHTFWEREARVEDAMLFRDVSRSTPGAGTLYAATEDRPARSARYREYLAPQGFGDELRAAFRLGQSTWGVVALHREAGRDPFSPHELDLVRQLSAVIALSLRSVALGERVAATRAGDGPGTALFDERVELLSLNERAERMFAEVAGPGWRSAMTGWDYGMTPIAAVLARAQAVADGTESRPAVARIRALSGRWLSVHATRMRTADGRPGPLAVTIEPCQSAQLAPIIVEAYSLTEREQEVTRCVARGLSNPEIAAELHLSPHTVRDHLKAVFAKVGVGSRGELVAKLFAEHYAPAIHAPGGAVHVDR